MKRMRIFLSTIIVLLVSSCVNAQNASYVGLPIAYWDFESNSARTTTSETVPEMQINSGNTFDGKVGGTTTVSQRAGNGATYSGVAGSAISATTWPTTSTDPGTAATHYFQFTLNTTGFTGISVGVDVFTGITALAYPAAGIIYSTDGGTTWASGVAGALGSNNAWATKYVTLPSGANNNANVKIRIYGYYGANNANSVIGLDNLIVLATGTQTSAGAKTSLDEGVLVTSYTSGTAPSSSNLYTRNTGFTVTSGSELIINNTSATSGPRLASGATITVSSGGQITFGNTGILQGVGNFNLLTGGTIKCANLSGVTVSGATGCIQSSGTRTLSTGTSFIYNGSGAQQAGNGLPASITNLTINNSSGVTLSGSVTVGTALTLTSGVLDASSFTVTANGTISGTGASNYIKGNLAKPVTGVNPVTFEVGDVNYAPVQLTFNTAPTAGTITIKSTSGTYPTGGSGISSSNNINHYWSIAASGVTGISSVTPKFTYNAGDIGGGSTAGFVGQKYSGGWLGSAITMTHTSSPYTSAPSSALSSAAYTGDYVIGKPVPVLVAAAGATVDNPFTITFSPDDAAFRSGITQITANGNILPAGCYSTTSAGQIVFTPSASTGYLTTATTYNIVVTSTGYGGVTVTQTLGAGVAAKLGMSVQPVDPASNGAVFSVQPTVNIQDQYGNITTGTATVVASVGAGSWTIGGTTSLTGTNTIAFTNLTASSAAAVTGATIQFNTTGTPVLTGVTSTLFNIPRLPISGTINVPGDYPTLGQAIHAVNVSGLSGATIINVTADQASTTTAGNTAEGSVTGAIGSGYIINITGTYAPTATNTLTIQGNGHTVTTPALSAATNYNDAVFTIAGTSYVTIDNFVMKENAANTTIAASNNMTEFGVAIVRGATSTSGSQYNTVSNCKIQLSSSYTNSIGIYSNADNNYATAYTTSTAPSSAAGANSYNSFYADTIIGATSGIVLLGDATYNDINTTVGSLGNGDSVSLGIRTTNMVMGSTYINYSLSQQDGIYAINNFNINANYNRIGLATGSTTNTVNGIYVNSCATGSPFTTQITNNRIALRTAASTTYTGIQNATSSITNATLKLNNNVVTFNGTNASSTMYGIYNRGAALVANFNNNSVNDTTLFLTYSIYNTGSIATATFNNNRAFGYLSADGQIYSIYNAATGTITTANFDNNRVDIQDTYAGTFSQICLRNAGAITNFSMSNNNLSITATALTTNAFGAYNTGAIGASGVMSYDTIYVNAVGQALVNTATMPVGTFNYNQISLAPIGTTAAYGIYNTGAVAVGDYSYNNITSASTIAGTFYGVSLSGATTTSTINNNTMNTVNSGTAYGVYFVSSGTNFTASNNDIKIRQTANNGAYGIYYSPTTALPNTYINNNSIDLSTTGSATSAMAAYIYSYPTGANASGVKNVMNSNVFKSSNGFVTTTGTIAFVYMAYENPTDSICFNRTQSAAGVGGTITKTGTGGGIFYGVYGDFGGSAYNMTTVYGNNFSNISIPGSTIFFGFNLGYYAGQAKNMCFDTLSNIVAGTGAWAGFSNDYSNTTNTIFNNYIRNIATQGDIYGITYSDYATAGLAAANALGGVAYNNTIDSLYSSAASATIQGVNFAGTSASLFTAYNNKISRLIAGGTTAPTLYGVNMTNGTTPNIYANTISNFSTASGATANAKEYGIYSSSTAATTTSIYKNNIYNLSAGTSGGSTTQVNGIYIPGSTASSVYNIYNNFISALTAPSANNYDAVIGINLTTTGPSWRVYYNTICLPSLGGGSNFGAAGVLFPSGTSLLSLKNNIINMATSSTLSGTGIAACIRRNVSGVGGTAPATTNYDGNYNILYVNSGSRNYFYAEQTGGTTVTNGYNLTTDPSFNLCGSAFKTYMSNGRESTTNTENNLTVGATTGTYAPTTASYAYQNGLQITTPAISDDYSGATRSTPPCIGALEFAGSYPATGAPVITYSPIYATSYCIAAPPTLSASIVATANINTTPGTKPRLYYRGSSDLNQYATTNTSANDGWKWVEASNSSSPFTFTPDYTLLSHTVAAGTVISYFVIAQDLSASPLVSSKTVGYNANYCPTSVALPSGAFPVTSLPVINTYTVTAVPTFTNAITPSTACGTSGTVTLSVSPNPADLALQWQVDAGAGYSNISGATSNSYPSTPPSIASTSGTINYKSGIYCNGVLLSTTTATGITAYNPYIVTPPSPVVRCGAGAVTLSATGAPGTVLEWFSTATGGTTLGAGSSFVTPSISSTTTFYVADSFGNYGNPEAVGPNTTAIGTTSSTRFFGTFNNAGINFTVNTPLTLKSVDIYPNSSGRAFTINIYSSAGTLLNTISGTTSTTTGPQTVTFNTYLAPGSYQLEFGSLTNTANTMKSNTSGFSFPYSTPTGTITLTSSTDPNTYFYFYNFQVVAGCLSARTAVTATVNALPTAGTVAATPSSLCEGATLTLTETGTPSGAGTLTSYNWTGPNGYTSSGTGPTVSPASLTTATTSASGIYSLTVTYPNPGCTSAPVTTSYVTVNANTTPVISGTLSACVGGTRTLTANIPSGTWSTTDATVATVDGSLGVVYATGAGTVTINYTSPCGSVGSATFTTNATPAAISGVSELCISSVTTMSNTVGGGTWSSTNTFAASVNSSTGVVTSGASTGTTTISYTIGSCGVARSLIVSNNSPGTITGSSSVCVGGVTTLSCTPAGGAWSTSSSAIATVTSSGAVTGVSNGSATIMYSTGCGTPATQVMSVNGTSIALATNGPLCSGSTASLTATISGSGTYSWTGPNSFTSALQNPTISSVGTNASGTYSFTATVGGCATSSSVNLAVDATPTVTVGASPAVICDGGTSVLSDVVNAPTSFMVNAIPYAAATLLSPTTLNSASGWTGGYDDGYINVSLGFTFNMFGTNYTSVNISPNGYVNFGTLSASYASSPVSLPATGSSIPKNMIALFWHDMTLSSGTITYGVMGSAPNRTFIINYNAVPDASGLSTNTGQVVLHETTNNIEVMVSNTAASTKTCGVQNLTGTTAITANGENNANYAVTSAAPQGWRFATPSYNYAWSPATALTSTSVASPSSIGLSATQIYTVQTNDIYSACTGRTSTATVTVNADPVVASVTPSATDACSGGTVTLTAGALSGGAGSFVSYVWSGPGGYSSTVSAIGTTTLAVTPTVTGAYSVVANYSGSGCSGTTPAVSSTVNVYAQPSVTSNTPSFTSACAGSSLTITSTTSGGFGTATYTWSGSAITTVTGSSATSPVLTPTLAGTNLYSLALHYSGTGCNDAGSFVNVTTNPVPSVVLGAVPNRCEGITLVPVPYYSATGGPTSYSVDWSPAANAAGINDLPNASLGGGSFNLVMPASGGIGSFDGTVTVSNGSCTSDPYAVHIISYATPVMSVNSVTTPCVNHAGSIDFTGSDSATVNYTVDGGSVQHFTFSGTTYSLSTGPISGPHAYDIVSATAPACAATIYHDTVTITPTQMEWIGGTTGHETDWNTATNWGCGFVPTNTDSVIINNMSYPPVMPTSVSAAVKDLDVASGSVIALSSGSDLSVKGDIHNSGSVTGSGKVILNGSGAQKIYGIGTINNVVLNNASGATIQVGSRMMIGSTLTLSVGTLTTNDSLELLSTDTNATARIAEIPASGAAVAGRVKTDQYVQGGYRRYRFWGHSFSDTISMSQLVPFIDITGPGGSANGFTTTTTNAASAYWHNPYGSADDTTGYDPGWRSFNDIRPGTADTNLLHPGQGIRVFFRGSKGEGLGWVGSYGSYTPSSVIAKMMGHVNQGPVSIRLKRGTANQTLNQLSNPYPSPVDLGTAAYYARQAGQITGFAFYVWNPALGAGGQYMVVPIGTSGPEPFYIPANTSFQVRADHDGAHLDFIESYKSADRTVNLFRAPANSVRFNIYDTNNHLWDMLSLQFNDKATDAEDKLLDAIKPAGFDFNFYSIASDGRRMAVDARPYEGDKVIPLGIKSAYQQDFVLRAEAINVPEGGAVTLHDKLLNKYVDMKEGTEYKFTIGKDKATQGEDRFELSLKPTKAAVVKGLEVAMAPNPASDNVQITFTSGSKDNVSVRIMDVSGVSIYSQDLGAKQNGVLTVPMSNFAAGVYMVELTQGEQKVTRRLIKE